MAIKVQGDTVVYNDKTFKVASGTTAQRPASPQIGMIRFNTNENSLEQYDGSGWNSVAPSVLEYAIKEPEITSPSNGTTIAGLEPTISGTTYSPLYTTDTRDYRLFEVDINTGDFSAPVVSKQVNSDSYTLSTILDPDTNYKVRISDVSVNGTVSNYSSVVSFTTPNIYVEQPTVTVEGSPSDVPENPTVTTSTFSVFNGTDTHESTDWEVIRTSDSTVVFSSIGDTVNLTSIDVTTNLSTSTEYEFRARHNGTTYGSSAYGSNTATTVGQFSDLLTIDDGQPFIQYGDSTKGFFGEVTTANFIAGDSLASSIGLSAGTAYNSTSPWLKFAYQGSVIYIAKKPYRHSLSHENIYEAGAAYGSGNTGNEPHATWSELNWKNTDPTQTTQNASVTIGGVSFDVRLIQGTDAEFSDAQTTTAYNEWNQLIYAVHVDTNTEGWGVNYTDSDMIFSSGDGRGSWVQESNSSGSDLRVFRGNSGVTLSNNSYSNYALSNTGWRPALVPSSS